MVFTLRHALPRLPNRLHMLAPDVYKSLFDSSSVPGYILSPHEDPVILAVNDAALAIIGRSRDSLLGKRFFDASPDAPSVNSDNERAVRESLARVRATGQPDEMAVQRYPVRLPSPTGQDVREERYWSAFNTPIFDDAGTLICVSHRARDVTELWRMQDALRRTNERQTFYWYSQIACGPCAHHGRLPAPRSTYCSSAFNFRG